jgi:hypothetical protein
MHGSEIQLFARYAQAVYKPPHYASLVFFMYFDKKFTLAKAYVLREFTRLLIQRRPQIAKDIRHYYNCFIYEKYQTNDKVKLYIGTWNS